ncbi:MAG: tRNA (adenosine(37)-N6)-threonylcarbamoyltransferase complex transferase subunit TsaD [Candidatus Zhuqueibacterota bacterium]
MIVLGIETSCDETAAAIYGDEGLQSNIIASQTVHAEYGGVVPELASREHIRLILPIVREAIEQAKIKFEQVEGIAVTFGPGLVGSILVGLNAAKAMAYTRKLPWVGVNHIEGHIFSIFLNHPELTMPFISLIISGGHTQLIAVKGLGHYEILGRTLDDAAGEAFDKVAKMLELGYPGGPIIDKVSRNGDSDFAKFPRALMKEDDFNFSFSGLKTAVLYFLKKMSPEDRHANRANIAASFQSALVETLVEKTLHAAKKMRIKQVVLAGGVARNSYLRATMSARAEQENLQVNIPDPIFCTDNAAMVAWVGYQKLRKGITSDYQLAPLPNLKL